ncbi:MAG TPA: nuclear transport factor 2 family protein [Candidatus Thalassarchaeaceae archaeon]|nr:nuclear transport factor 2 family protein [Candidatus Thalassarchaeaceae archaeon]|tara:strand:- start:107 stop:457 length:351 start_codon:yes stop_codon:yes gene_type:complete
MSILAAYLAALESGDANALDAILHDEFTFTPHVADTVMRKEDVLAFAGSGAVRTEGHRILYENAEVGVEHVIAHFSNNSTSEAVLSFHRFKDGRIISTETGATPLSDDYSLVGSDV